MSYCHNYRTKEEMYRYLSVDINTIDKLADEQISPKVSVEKCLANFFRPEDREIKCEKCEEGTEATQTLRILSQPKALLIHLKRFVLVERPSSGGEDDKENNLEVTFQKNRAAVELTEELSLEDFMKDEKMKSRPTKPRYALKSIVHHIGSTANSGHYTADALRPGRPHVGEDQEAGAQTCEPQWVSYDDGLTTETTLAALRGNISNQRTAYILLYSIE